MVPADIAYFGQKDYQQQTIIRKMVSDLNLPITIRVCPTIRETDGLAMSSRNVYLNSEQRQVSLALFRTLEMARTELARGARDLPALRQRLRACLGADPAVQPDYATLVDPDTLAELDTPGPRVVALVAARVGTTRLIDNAVIDLR
jgi:pantoate--beta-alanine ligase